jgi:two-component system, sensor histidine kinase and response regulator
MNSSNKITDRIKILKGISLFEVLDNEMLFSIAQVLTHLKLNNGEILFEKGAKDYSLYLIVKGKVRVHDGEHTFAHFTNNQYFGEYSLIDSTPRSATITAVEPTSLLRLNQDSFLKITQEHSEINQFLMKGLIWRLRDYNLMEAELTRKNAEIEQQKAILEKQRKELEALNTTKDKFFAIIAHDLKNPFSTVLGISELLAREFESFDPESLKEFITQIYKYSNNTYNLLENLLQWSMVQTGRMPMSPSLVNLASVIEENVELLLGNAKQKKITIESLASNGYLAFADVNMLTTVVRNLLSNAIKFTSNGGNIKVNIGEEGLSWKVSVTDNGIGISEKDLKNLFLLDSNPTSIGTSQEKGTGLGLILCKEFVERNHGKIGVNSLIGTGTTFWFTVPKATS